MKIKLYYKQAVASLILYGFSICEVFARGRLQGGTDANLEDVADNLDGAVTSFTGALYNLCGLIGIAMMIGGGMKAWRSLNGSRESVGKSAGIFVVGTIMVGITYGQDIIINTFFK